MSKTSTTFDFFGIPLISRDISSPPHISRESFLYAFLKRIAKKHDLIYTRIETRDKAGIPDVILFAQEIYIFVECKLLRKKELIDLKNDLHWQDGQIAFATEALKKQCAYVLMVGHDKTITIITHEGNQALFGFFEGEHHDEG